MKKTIKKSKLELRREKLRVLGDNQLGQVVGGSGYIDCTGVGCVGEATKQPGACSNGVCTM